MDVDGSFGLVLERLVVDVLGNVSATPNSLVVQLRPRTLAGPSESTSATSGLPRHQLWQAEGPSEPSQAEATAGDRGLLERWDHTRVISKSRFPFFWPICCAFGCSQGPSRRRVVSSAHFSWVASSSAGPLPTG